MLINAQDQSGSRAVILSPGSWAPPAVQPSQLLSPNCLVMVRPPSDHRQTCSDEPALPLHSDRCLPRRLLPATPQTGRVSPHYFDLSQRNSEPQASLALPSTAQNIHNDLECLPESHICLLIHHLLSLLCILLADLDTRSLGIPKQ